MVVLVPGPVDAERVAAFTLQTALAWLGHACRGVCPPAVSVIPAQTWVVRPIDHDSSSRTETLVLLEFGPTSPLSASAASLLVEVNLCTAVDHLRVCDTSGPAGS